MHLLMNITHLISHTQYVVVFIIGRRMGQGTPLSAEYPNYCRKPLLCSQAQEWTTLTAAQRSTIKSQYAAAGIKLIVSAFGSTDIPTSTNADPIATANNFANWVKQYSLDGIDVDYEDFGAFDSGSGKAEVRIWLGSKYQRTGESFC